MNAKELIPTLVERFPAFRGRWLEYQTLWEGDDSPRSYLVAAEFSGFVLERFECGDGETPRPVEILTSYRRSQLPTSQSAPNLTPSGRFGILPERLQ
jgi:hypothetical protein